MNKQLLLLLGVMGVLSGCVSTGMARTLNEGQFQVSVTPGVHTDRPLTAVRALHAEVGMRYGVTDRLDVGARLFLWGAAVDTRIGLLRSPTLDSGVDLTLAPTLTLSARGSSDDKQLTAELPLLWGFNPGAGVQVVLGPRIGTTVVVDPNGFGEPHALVGSSFGVALPVGKWLRIVPEVAVRTEVTRFEPMFQGNIGFLLGGYVED